MSRFCLVLLTSICILLCACGKVSRQPVSANISRPDTNSIQTSAKVNINHANAAELEKLPGVGKAIAERIIAHRSTFGPFRRTEHLMMVRGISDKKFRELQSLITV